MSAGSKKTATTQRQLVDKIYAAALDPAGYVNIVQAWDAHYEALRDAQADDQAEDFDWAKEFFVHFQRAGEIFERLSSNSAISVADRAGAMAKSAFVVEGSGRITFANPQAVDELGVLQGRFLDDLAFDQPSRVAMRDLLKGVQSGLEKSLADRKALRLVQDGMDEPTIFVGGIVDDPQSGQQVLFVWSANHHWHEAVRGILSNSFGLTDAELELVKRLQLGGTIKDISAETGRSQATLRTQLSATLSKMNLKSQVALARTITGLVTSLSRESAVLPDIASKQFKATTANQRSYTIDISGDRRVQIVESGDLAGQPFYFIQTTTWPTLTEEIVTRCADHGIRIVSPYRSGVGDTTKLSIKMNLRELAAYHQEILARLGIGRVLVGGQCSGGIYALELARALQGNCAGVVLVDTGAPLQNVGMINQMPLAPRRLFLAARFFPLALRTPYKMAHTDFYSGADGEARGVQYFVDGSPHDEQSVTDQMMWEVIRDNFDYVMRNREQAIKDVRFWAADTSVLATEVMETIPITYLQGRENLLFPPHHVEVLAQRQPNVTARVIDDEAQLLIYRRPDLFAETIADALQNSDR